MFKKLHAVDDDGEHTHAIRLSLRKTLDGRQAGRRIGRQAVDWSGADIVLSVHRYRIVLIDRNQ